MIDYGGGALEVYLRYMIHTRQATGVVYLWLATLILDQKGPGA